MEFVLNCDPSDATFDKNSTNQPQYKKRKYKDLLNEMTKPKNEKENEKSMNGLGGGTFEKVPKI